MCWRNMHLRYRAAKAHARCMPLWVDMSKAVAGLHRAVHRPTRQARSKVHAAMSGVQKHNCVERGLHANAAGPPSTPPPMTWPASTHIRACMHAPSWRTVCRVLGDYRRNRVPKADGAVVRAREQEVGVQGQARDRLLVADVAAHVHVARCRPHLQAARPAHHQCQDDTERGRGRGRLRVPERASLVVAFYHLLTIWHGSHTNMSIVRASVDRYEHMYNPRHATAARLLPPKRPLLRCPRGHAPE